MKPFIKVRKKVTLVSRQSNEPPLDFVLLKKELETHHEGIEVVILPRKLEMTPKGCLSYIPHLFTQMYHFASSQVVVLDSYSIAASVLKHKKGLIIIQMWHSMGTMKRFGYSTLGTGEGSSRAVAKAFKMHHNYDWIFASSDAYEQHLADGFGYEVESVIVKPLPRLDLLMSEAYRKGKREEVQSKYPQLIEKKTILYCPTFRKDEQGFSDALNKLVGLIDFEKYNLVLATHPLSKPQIENEGIIVDRDISTFEMLFVADYVISDYSCVVYEAAVLELPTYFYCFDKELYDTSRGLAIDYERECPGVISKDPKDIIEAIETEEYDFDKLRNFSETYVRATPNATGDIAEFIAEMMKD